MISQFERRGYAVYPSAISTETIDQLRVEAELVRDWLLMQMRHTQVTDPRFTWWRLDDGQPYLLKIKPVLDLAPTAATVANGRWMTERIGDLLAATPILMENKFMYKQRLATAADWADLPVLGEEVCKHTDAAYFAQRGYGRVLSVAVCLDDCTPVSGGLKVWPGSHRRSIDLAPTARQGLLVPDDQAPDSDAVLLEARAGSVLVWESSLVHASDPNRSDLPRRLLVLGFTAGGPA